MLHTLPSSHAPLFDPPPPPPRSSSLLLHPHPQPHKMLDFKDSAIKLFGQTIPLPPFINRAATNDDSSSSETAAVSEEDCCGERSSTFLHENDISERDLEEQEANRDPCVEEITDDKQEDDTSILVAEDSKDQAATSGVCDNPKTPSVERETSSLKSSKSGEQSETSTSQEKTLKKPDKILPCPRCNSMDTKFCYYNNYNVNQPRHFCKNCQRYWTAGGTMRNVPVGAGRRKNKSSAASHYRQMMVSEAFRTAQVHAMNGIHHSPSLGNNGAVLTFGVDSPLCESVSSMLNLSEKTQAGFPKVYHRPQQRILVPCGRTADNGDDPSSGSSVTTSNSPGQGGHGGSQDGVIKNHQGFPPQLPCFPAPPWPCPWNPSGFPVSFYPAPSYWGCAVPSPWNAPSRLSPSSPSLKHSTQSSSPTSPLGKHSRDGNIIKPASSEDPSREHNSSERRVLVPKTLRIDDPSEAAKSSIWATLEIKREKSSYVNGAGVGLFKGLESKKEDRNCVAEASPVLRANPAALSRSLKFHESA